MKNIRAVIIVLALLSTGGSSANAAQTSDGPSEESGSGLGQSRWTWEMIHLPSFILLLAVMRAELPAKIMIPEV